MATTTTTATAAFFSSSFKPHQRTLNPRRRRPNRSHFASAAAKSDGSYFAAAASEISSHLLRSLPTGLHPSVQTPILRLLSSPSPPSIAPPLCLAASQLVARIPNPTPALDAACAFHLIHAVARARASGILAGADLMSGDALLALAYSIIARTPAAGDSEGGVRVMKVLMEVAETAAAVAAAAEEGEKEGKLAAGAAACGVRVAGGAEEEVERARRIGMFAGKMEWAKAENELGLGFQKGRAAAVRRLLQEMMMLKQDLAE